MRIAVLSTVLLAAACGGAPFSSELQGAPDAGMDDRGAITQEPDAGDAAEATTVEAAVEAGAPEAGAVDAGPTCTCTGDLSGVGLGDFTVAFTLATTSQPASPGYMALLNQRSTCTAATPGWDVWMSPAGTVWVEVFSGGNVFDNVQSAAVLNDGQEHRVVITRLQHGSLFQIEIDGKVSGYPGAPLEALTGKLAPLATGTDTTCTANAGQPAYPLSGLLTKVCVGPCN